MIGQIYSQNIMGISGPYETKSQATVVDGLSDADLREDSDGEAHYVGG